MLQDPISDLLVKIKNASASQKKEVTAIYSKVNQNIAELLKKEGFIKSIKKDGYNLAIILNTDAPVTVAKRISRPTVHFYAKAEAMGKEIRKVGTVLVSTNKGIMTAKNAKKGNLGGELICEVW